MNDTKLSRTDWMQLGILTTLVIVATAGWGFSLAEHGLRVRRDATIKARDTEIIALHARLEFEDVSENAITLGLVQEVLLQEVLNLELPIVSIVPNMIGAVVLIGEDICQSFVFGIDMNGNDISGPSGAPFICGGG